MSILTIPRNGIALLDVNGGMSAEWYRWAHDITGRAGGVSGSSTTELSLSQFEDAGIEEAKATLYRSVQDAGQVPIAFSPAAVDDQLPPPITQLAADDLLAQVQALTDQLSELAKAVQSLQQATLL